jgi:hypothetical protein
MFQNELLNRVAKNAPVTVDAVYDKIAGVEIPVSQALVRETSQKMIQILREATPPKAELFPGYRLRIVDGNKIAATDRRLKALRGQSAAPLPGFALVVFEPAWNLITHTVLCRDGHAQERKLFWKQNNSRFMKDLSVHRFLIVYLIPTTRG